MRNLCWRDAARRDVIVDDVLKQKGALMSALFLYASAWWDCSHGDQCGLSYRSFIANLCVRPQFQYDMAAHFLSQGVMEYF